MIFSLAACGADSQESKTDSIETEVVSDTDVSGQDGQEGELDHTAVQNDPTGAETGTLRVYRGGGQNDFAKNMRSAYRAAMAENKSSFNIGIRLVRNAVNGTGSVVNAGTENTESADGKVLIAYFS